MMLSELIAQLSDTFNEHGEDSEVRVQDEDGIYSSDVVAVETANGAWIIVKTQPKEV